MTVTAPGASGSIGVYGAYVKPGNFSGATAAVPANASVLARFGSDGSPAATVRSAGAGRAVFIGFLPSLSYFKPALPSRPIDICPRDGPHGCFCHFVPEAFDVAAVTLLNLPPPSGSKRGGAAVVGAVVASDPLVEVGVVNAKQIGSVLLLINWQMQPSRNLTISIAADGERVGEFSTAVRASDGDAVVFEASENGRWVFTLPGVLEVADAIILRP